MPKALVCINTDSSPAEIVSDLKKVDGVSEAYPARGLYDVVALIHADSVTELKELVSKRIKSIVNVKSILTLTMIDNIATI